LEGWEVGRLTLIYFPTSQLPNLPTFQFPNPWSKNIFKPYLISVENDYICAIIQKDKEGTKVPFFIEKI
jgi:hypothetical protein